MRKALRIVVVAVLVLIAAASLCPVSLTGRSYAAQFRESPNAGCSRQFPLGTDELGRDRLARLLYAVRLSILLAPAAALVSTALAAVIGGVAGYAGGWCDRIIGRGIDLMLSLPWLFLLITVRSLLPLNVAPAMSVLITFGLLSILGWPAPARVVRTGARAMRDSDALLQARAAGIRPVRLLLVQVVPNLKPILLARFWTLIPAFILSEANLGLLGLGISEPLPSWGNLLRGLENQFSPHVGVLAPLILLVVVMSCLQWLLPVEDVSS